MAAALNITLRILCACASGARTTCSDAHAASAASLLTLSVVCSTLQKAAGVLRHLPRAYSVYACRTPTLSVFYFGYCYNRFWQTHELAVSCKNALSGVVSLARGSRLSDAEVESVWRGERPCEGYAYGPEQYAPMRIPHCHSDASTARS